METEMEIINATVAELPDRMKLLNKPPEKKMRVFIQDVEEIEQARQKAERIRREMKKGLKDQDPEEIERTIDKAIKEVRANVT